MYNKHKTELVSFGPLGNQVHIHFNGTNGVKKNVIREGYPRVSTKTCLLES